MIKSMLAACGRSFLAASLCAVLTLPAAAAEGPAVEQVSERVFLVRDKAGTQTQFQMIVNAGCNDEADGECKGIAHYLEHLILNARNPENTNLASRFFLDGASNGSTSREFTSYEHSMPARAESARAGLEKLFEFYAARLKGFAATEDELVRERDVVLQEYDYSLGNFPFLIFNQRLRRALLPTHPSGQWGGGTREDIAAYNLEAVRAFHRAWYAPNNVYFVIKSDIEPAVLEAVAKKALADIPPRALPARISEPIIQVDRLHFNQTERSARSANVLYRKLVRIEDERSVDTEAAATIVSNFLTSWLAGSPHDVIVDQLRLTDKVSAGIQRVAPNTYALNLEATAPAGADPERLLRAMSDYVDGFADAGISAASLDRLKLRYIRNQALTDRLPAKVFSRLLDWLKSGYRYEDLARMRERIATTSSEDLIPVLRALSGLGRVVTGIHLPVIDEAAR